MLTKPVAAAVGAAIAFCAVAVSAPRRGAAASACSDTVGVTVIVDFTHFGGTIERGCEPDAPANALDAVHAAGFTTAGTARYGDAFVCRIDSLPSPKSEACIDTPPATSSWSFYHARSTDKAWTYSTVGVLGYHPAPGTLLAFAFGHFAKPGVLPSGAVVPTSTTTTTPRKPRPRTTPPVTAPVHPPATTTPSPIAPPPTVATVGVAPTPTPTTAKQPVKHPATTRPDTPATRPDASTTAPPRIVDKTASGPVAGDGGSSGSPWPAVLTVALVAALGAGALATIRTRRRRAT